MAAAPAGLAAAIAARQRGFDVIVAEKRRYPIDKPCGEGLMPDGVAALRQLGITALDRYGRRFYGIRFIDNDRSIGARFAQAWGIGIRRPILQQCLAERARTVGAAILCGTAVSMRQNKIWLGEQEARAQWVIGADGRASSARRYLDYPAPSYGSRRLALRQHFRVRPWTSFVEVHWRDRCQAYVTPVNDQELCIALTGSDRAMRMDHLPRLFPDLARRLANAKPTSTVAGMDVTKTCLSTIAKNNCALIGDASGCSDPIIGIGLSLAFQQAIALGESLACGNLAAYRRAHKRMTRVPRLLTNFLLLLDERHALRRILFRYFAAQPNLFHWLLELRVRHVHGAPAKAAASVES